MTDGVTLGHPCCGFHDCQNPLDKQYHKYCLAHASLNKVCAIQGCDQPALDGFASCDEATHRARDLERIVVNKAMPRLKKSLLKAQASGDSFDEGLTPEASKRLTGQFSRRWTHNEQLFVRCCGVIVSRATFFGSEAISAVKVLILSCCV